jgi:hypothetical protein
MSMEIQEFLNKVLGARAAVGAKQELLYDRREDAQSSIMRRDLQWLHAHPRQERFIRPALGSEFGVHEVFIDYDGKRYHAPKLWVWVQSHGWFQTVVPIYVGECFWPTDADGYILLDKEDEDSPNGKADVLRWRMHKYGGVNQLERDAYEAKIAEYLTVCCLAPVNERSN